MFDQAFCRSTEAEVSLPVRSTDVHKRAQTIWLEGRSTDPVNRQRALLSGSGPGRPSGRPAESSALCFQASVDRPVDWWHNGRKFDRWPVDRAIDRQQNFSAVLAQRLVFRMGYKYPFIWAIFIRISRPKFSIFLSVLTSFQEFLGLKILSLFVF